MATYTRKSWTKAEKLTLRMSAIDRSNMAVYKDSTGRTWSQSQVEALVSAGRMKITRDAKKRNVRNVVIGRTLTVLIRPIVRARPKKVAA